MSGAAKIIRIEGRALPMRGNDIDTDRIVPARYLRAITFDGMEQFTFIDERAGGPSATPGAVHPFDDPRFQGASVLLVNSNFGCGSSREHAPQAIYRWGIRAIVGESFSEIFFGNSAMIGLPCVTAPAAEIEKLMAAVEQDPKTAVTVDLSTNLVRAGSISTAISMPPKIREALVTGAWDTTGLLLDRYAEVDATAAKLPYVSGF